MRVSSDTFFRVYVLVILLNMFGLLYANPKIPQPITRVYFIDSQHWVMEIDIEELWFSSDKLDPGDITVGCGETTSSGTPLMQKCVKPVEINTDSGIGFVSSEHVPGIELMPGSTVFVGVEGDEYLNEGVDLPEDIEPNSTIELNFYQTTCSEYIGTGSPVYDDAGNLISMPTEGEYYTWECWMSEYDVTTCKGNSGLYGRINGILTDTRGRPCPSFSVACFADTMGRLVGNTRTRGDGSFNLENLDPSLIHMLRFSFREYQVDRPVRPFCDESGPLDLTIRLQFPLTALTCKNKELLHTADAVRILPSSGKNGNLIVFTVSDNALKGNGVCEMYTLNGARIGSMPFTSHGVGTYSIPLRSTLKSRSPFSASTCLYRISIGSELICKRIITY